MLKYYSGQALCCGKACPLYAAAICGCLLLSVYLVGNGELLATFGAAHGKHAATVLGGHALAEAVLIVALSVVGLECSFHLSLYFFIRFSPLRAAKVVIIFELTKN